MIGVIGLGFVGLTTALGFAEKTGYPIWGYEKNESRRSTLAANRVPFYEPGLPEALAKHLGNRFHLASSMKEVVQNCKVIFYCVGTPARDDGHADLRILESAIGETLAHVDKGDYKVLVVKSTVPPSTTSVDVAQVVRTLGFEPGIDIGLSNNPEFLREGHSWDDFTNPDRIVIGALDEQSGAAVAKLYENFKAPIFRVSLNTGEYIKYLSNTLLATLISYANEMSIIADTIGEIDVKKAFEVLHLDGRWFGNPAKISTYAYPGCGYGGYCLPKDTEAMYSRACSAGYEPVILNAVIKTNEIIKRHIIHKIINLVKDRNARIGILGLSFKPGSDDVRDTPAIYIIEGLLDAGYKNIIAHDPIAIDEFKHYYSYEIKYEASIDTMIDTCDVLVIATAWDEYHKKAKDIQSKPCIDARYCL